MRRDAIDGVQAAPPPELAAAGLVQWPYCGGALPDQMWFDACRALGLDPDVLIVESYATRSQAGQNAGWFDADQALARAALRDHRGGFDFAVSDGNSSDSWDCGPFAIGIALRLGPIPFFVYGSEGCCASAAAGARTVPGSGFIDFNGGSHIPETWGNGGVASQLVYTKAPISTPHDLNRVFYDFGGTTSPSPSPAPLLQEADVLYRATSDSSINPAVTAGTVWDNAGTRFLSVDPNTIPAGAIVRDVAGDDIGAVAAEQAKLQAAADATIAAGSRVESVVQAARQAVASSPKGTPPTKALMEDRVEAAIRGAS